MAEVSLEQFQRSQSVRIAQDIIGQSEEHQQKMQANWEKTWLKAHQHLVSLLRFLDKDYDEACEKSNHPLERFSDDDLFYLIHVRMRGLIEEVKQKTKPSQEAELQRQVQEFTRRVASLEQKNTDLGDENKKLQAEIAGLNAHLIAVRQVHQDIPSQVMPGDPVIDEQRADQFTAGQVPAWFNAWKASKTFEKMAMAIQVMGDTGMALRPSIIKEIARRLSLSPDNNSLDDALNRLLEQETDLHPVLIEKENAISAEGAGSGGNLPDVLRLTEKGNAAYSVLSGKVPKPNEYDRLIRCHSSPEHTILNIQACEVLVEVGYRIKGQAQAIQLSNGSTFIPDIIAAGPSSSELIFIEVERDVHKDPAARKQKWINCYEASHGNLYVFCDNLTCERAIQAEMNLALSGLRFNSYLTNLHGIRSGKRSKIDGSIWISMSRGK
jgi:hypothetical protein